MKEKHEQRIKEKNQNQNRNQNAKTKKAKEIYVLKYEFKRLQIYGINETLRNHQNNDLTRRMCKSADNAICYWVHFLLYVYPTYITCYTLTCVICSWTTGQNISTAITLTFSTCILIEFIIHIQCFAFVYK